MVYLKKLGEKESLLSFFALRLRFCCFDVTWREKTLDVFLNSLQRIHAMNTHVLNTEAPLKRNVLIRTHMYEYIQFNLQIM